MPIFLVQYCRYVFVDPSSSSRHACDAVVMGCLHLLALPTYLPTVPISHVRTMILVFFSPWGHTVRVQVCVSYVYFINSTLLYTVGVLAVLSYIWHMLKGSKYSYIIYRLFLLL